MVNSPKLEMGNTTSARNTPSPHSFSYISASQTSSLLHLPRELRDVIYIYALTQQGDMRYYRKECYKTIFCSSDEYARGARNEQSPPSPWNQLQFVCRQLRQETLGLELRLNSLVFGRDLSAGEYMSKLASVQFLGFLDMCSEVWQKRIKSVRLEGASFLVDENREAVYDLHLVVYWCQLHPQTTVYLPLPINRDTGQESPSSFLIDGIMIQSAMRRSLPSGYLDNLITDLGLYHLFCNARIYRKLWRPDAGMTTWWKINRVVEVEAENFRVVPDDGPFREGQFRKGMEKWRGGGDIGGRKPVGEVGERWVELAREWYERGL